MNTTIHLSDLKAKSIELGYRFEISDDGNEERMIRPDGIVAIVARWDRLAAAIRSPNSGKDPT